MFFANPVPALRNVAKTVFGAVSLLAMAVSSRSKALHDWVAGTTVQARDPGTARSREFSKVRLLDGGTRFTLRVGGAIRIHMRSPDGSVYPMKGEFREIVPPERLVFTNIAVDAAGQPIIEGLTTVTFIERDGKTTMTLHTRGRAVVDYAIGYLQGMEMGWTGSIDKLEILLARGG